MSANAYKHFFSPSSAPGAPTLLLLHGTGGDEHDLVPLAQRLAPHAALLSPRGDVSEHGALRFFRRLAEGVFDLDDVRRRSAALAAWVAAATQHHGLDPARVHALGLSNGANIAALLLQRHPQALAGAALLRPMVVLDEPAAAGSLTGRPVLVSSGTVDPIVPPDHPDRLAALLRAGGAEVTVRTHTASHGLVPGDMAALQDWAKTLG